MKLLAILAVLLLALSSAFLWQQDRDSQVGNADYCQLDSARAIIVACTSSCGVFNSLALSRAAASMDYDIDVIQDLSEQTTTTLADIDALVIPGGADINPKYYTANLPHDLQTQIHSLDHLVVYTPEGSRRDPFEYQLLRNYFGDPDLRTTPILGICRGLQMLSVSQQIPLYVDIKTELGIRNRTYHLDEITISEPTSLIGELLQRQSFTALELHHQALNLAYYRAHKEQFSHIDITAVSHGGRIAEVIEFRERPVMGTQFHPELSFGQVRKKPFQWLLQQACIKRNASKQDHMP